MPSFRAAAAPLVRRMVVYAGTDDLGSAFLALAAVLFWGGDIVFPAPGTGVFWDAAWYSETQVICCRLILHFL